MKQRFSFLLLSFVLLGAMVGVGLPSCNKSNSTGSGPTVDKGELPGNWAAQVVINTTNGHRDTVFFSVRPDTLVFMPNGKLNGIYAVQSFDTTTDQVVWLRTVDTASYTFVNDTTIHITGHTSLYIPNNAADTFRIRYLDAVQLQLYAADLGGSGGLLYVYSRF